VKEKDLTVAELFIKGDSMILNPVLLKILKKMDVTSALLHSVSWFFHLCCLSCPVLFCYNPAALLPNRTFPSVTCSAPVRI
jgi:hypothetical protein